MLLRVTVLISLGLLLRVTILISLFVLISLGLLLRDSVFDFSGCCCFCLGLCVSVFVVSSQVHMELEFLRLDLLQ